MANVVVSSLPAGTALSRYLMVKGLGGVHNIDVDARAWRQTPQVIECLRDEFRVVTKAAVPPGSTSDATNASPLAAYGLATEALALLRDVSIIGALEPKMRRVPFRTKVPRETGGGTGGAWIAEAYSTPIAATAYDDVFQEVYKAGKIVVLSKELLKVGVPDAERTVRETVMRGLAAYLDQQFLTPSVGLIAGLQPAAITASAPAIVSTGTTAAQISADLSAMLAAITTPGSGLTWIMRKKTMATIAGALGVASGLPQTLYGLPVVVSDNSPAQITLADASQLLYSDSGTIELDTSEEAALQMDGAPVDPPVAATVMTSLWQLDLWAVRAVKWIAYLRARSGSVSYMVVTY
jgi:HK97 family phage major capsid protein